MKTLSGLNRLAVLAAGASLLVFSAPVFSQDSSGFREFSAQVEKFLVIHKGGEAEVPPLKKTSNPEELEEREKLLATKIRELRLDARRGDIFTQHATEEFKRAINNTFSSPAARATLRAGEPLHNFKLQVNQIYPKGIPFTTVPPSLLMALPKLPDDLGYRILGPNLLLVDIPASVIIDFIPDVVPQPNEQRPNG